jgi:glycosyltransferase involved in cell wall biosynthesis
LTGKKQQTTSSNVQATTYQPNISLMLLTKNESQNILKNYSWLDKCPRINEIVAVDDYSDDDTLEVLRKHESKTRKVKIIKRKLNNNFAAQRNYLVTKTSNDWILWLDADEQPSVNFINYVNNIDINQYDNYAFTRSDCFLGYTLKHGETSSQTFLRLFNKNKGKFEGMVHEKWYSSSAFVKNEKNIMIYHCSHQTLSSFLNKINFYTDIRARELLDRGERSNIFQILFYPTAKFFQTYIIKLGLLDSTPGIIIALGMSFHSFLVRAKLWHLQQQK